MIPFVTAPFSDSTGTLAGISSIVAPRGTPSATTAFTQVLREVTEPEPAREPAGIDASIPLAQLMHMLLLLEIMGLPAPRWMIDAFRARGLDGIATSLEVRNVRLEAERLEELRLQRRRAGLA